VLLLFAAGLGAMVFDELSSGHVDASCNRYWCHGVIEADKSPMAYATYVIGQVATAAVVIFAALLAFRTWQKMQRAKRIARLRRRRNTTSRGTVI
jgi:hypothetical protein